MLLCIKWFWVWLRICLQFLNRFRLAGETGNSDVTNSKFRRLEGSDASKRNENQQLHRSQ